MMYLHHRALLLYIYQETRNKLTVLSRSYMFVIVNIEINFNSSLNWPLLA